MHKQDVVYTHNGTLSGPEKEGNPAIYNTDEAGRHYASEISQRQILYDLAYT